MRAPKGGGSDVLGLYTLEQMQEASLVGKAFASLSVCADFLKKLDLAIPLRSSQLAHPSAVSQKAVVLRDYLGLSHAQSNWKLCAQSNQQHKP